MSSIPALCVVLCAGANGGSVAEMEVLRSAIAEHGIEVTVYEAETPPRSDIQDILSAAALYTGVVRPSADNWQHIYTAPIGNSQCIVREAQGELPSEARL